MRDKQAQILIGISSIQVLGILCAGAMIKL